MNFAVDDECSNKFYRLLFKFLKNFTIFQFFSDKSLKFYKLNVRLFLFFFSKKKNDSFKNNINFLQQTSIKMIVLNDINLIQFLHRFSEIAI